MFEIIGMIAAWIFGAALSFYGPLYVGLAWRGGLETIVIGYRAAQLLLAVYIAATVVYFIAT